MKFVAIYMAPSEALDEMMKHTTPAERDAGMASWQAWMDSHEESFVDQGAALGKNKRVSKDGISDVRNEITGYAVVEANSHEEAAEIFSDSPHLDIDGAYVEVLTWVEMQ